ncbi:MAG: aminodeoxychorismate lyase [Nevskia sp.]
MTTTPEPAPPSWWNGRRDAAPPVLSRGLHYGDGVFRTMLLHGGRVVDLDIQLAKLAADAMALGLSAPSLLRGEIEAAVEGRAHGVVKLLLLRAGAGRGYRPASDDCDRLLLLYPPPDFPMSNARSGIAAIRSPVTMAAQPRLAGIKHLNRLEQVLASRAWPAGVDEAILGDDRGTPVCGTRSNLFWVARGVLNTPALDRCGVAGVMRAKLLALASRRNLEVRIASQPWSALIAADEAFVCNSLIGIWPLRALDDRTWSAPGPVTADLMQALAHPTLHTR